MQESTGYKGRALDLIKTAGASIGDKVTLTEEGESVEGLLMPRVAGEDDFYIVLKLATGYNVGVKIGGKARIQVLGTGAKPALSRAPTPPAIEGLPGVTIFSTGGTIASRVDYRTGAVEAALSAEDLYSFVPELASEANVNAKVLYSVFSENFTAQHWKETAEAVCKEIQSGVSGVVIAQGTDTLGYCAAAMSFALQSSPVPIVFVAAQRSSDRPSSDAATNLIGAVSVAAKAPFAGVVAVMHGWLSDDILLVHRGTKVRKCHTSRRDAFRSIDAAPLARFHIESRMLENLDSDFPVRGGSSKVVCKSNFDDRVALTKFYPGMDPGIIDWYVAKDYRGLILEGTGLGHVSARCYPSLKHAVDKGIFVGMTSQCIWGRVDMNVYSTGIDLQKIGVTPLEDMLPETALVKLMWVLGQTDNARKIAEMMQTNMAGEISPRRLEASQDDKGH
jgi:glutamyl-tRNA(Gln) amidotransferase subunit D